MADKNVQILEQQSVSVEIKTPSPNEYVEKKVETKKIRVKRGIIEAPIQPCPEGYERDSNGKCRQIFD